ncbi:MAG: metallopeptidase-like protein [Candidatus Woesebacteria bacterium GW2011_GWC1_38_13]|uniref:Metallopeptidase-like protein n=3 Tax=Candidatus Woeseibacteriota TaxID=1752722 RepID=A0A0G0KYS5_9BACT|nr:MAG: Metallopeptidase-like protein [Candidatus Woesebacteria bacterium GW2011_GWD1_38_10]KKQ56660.1 MAG: metallopeptidase-like protein [Candidatus Woesebacteria bacterium GW2011_GWC1_38_13]KKQ84823.1 MAG: Metallopeptidase-like protein [Candidatus Woesebacteria bacterium GW2011_GWA1_38_8]
MRLKKALKYIRLTKEKKKRRKKKTSSAVLWEKASDVEKDLKRLINLSKLPYDIKNITSLRSYNSRARAYARIWGLSRVWQMSLNVPPHYIIEILSEKFDELSKERKDEVLLHELAHIPSNFSGSLLPHIRRGKRNFKSKVDRLIREVRMNDGKRY